MPHSRDLEAFLATAQHLHMTRAAASLFLTQPALSKRIANLERGYGVQLFTRRHDGVALSQAGQALLPYAERILTLGREATEELLALNRGHKLVVGYWLSPPNSTLRAAARSMAGAHPGVTLRMRRADWSEAGAGVSSGEADVSVVHARHDHGVHGLRHHRVLVEDLVVALPPGHRLADRESIAASELHSETLLTLPSSAGELSGLRWLPRGVSVQGVEFVTSIDETMENITSGLGVCVLTPTALAAYPQANVVAVPVRDVDPADLLLSWRAEDEARPEVRTLIRALVEAYRSGE